PRPGQDDPTVVLPAVPPPATTRPHPVVADGTGPVLRGVRVLETTAGLLSSGLLVLTAVLLAAVVVAPLVVDGATGPQWWRIGVGAAVAVPGELIRVGRTRRPVAVRAVLAVLVLVAVPAVLALTWWW